jgi:hypothetical protein
MSHSKIGLRAVAPVLIGIGIAGYLAVGPKVSKVSAQGGCSAASFSGGYGFLVNSVNSNGTARDATLGILSPDGAGNLSGSFTTSPPSQTGTLTGTYSVNSDCSGTMTITDSLGGNPSFAFVLTNAGSNVQLLRTNGANVVTGTGIMQ